MNSNSIIINIKSKEDVNNITADTKYINLSIDNINTEIIDYFLLNGKDYSYADTINCRNGFIYADYETFKLGESVIDNIIDNMPNHLNELEKVRYIYISLGKIISSDINTIEDKNDIISFNKISVINNIWGSLSKGKVCDSVTSKMFMYLCTRIGIKCEIINSSIKGNIANKVYIDDTFLIVDLFNDIHNIQGGFCTCFFDKYNDNKEMDRKILYIDEEYTEYYLSNILSEMDYTQDDILFQTLTLTNGIINVSNIGVTELFKIYRNIFDKYMPNCDIKINNFFIYRNFYNKEHFLVFNYKNNYYCFNYNRKCFINIEENVFFDNIKKKKIGIYNEEDFDFREKRVIS